ncbi:MAG: phage Gp37/Gp68 family protein [Verrucomicrobiota bacterium]
MKDTKIEWAHHTFNPWWGCEKVSPACAHCYAETFSKRTGHKVWGKDSERRFFGDKHWFEPRKWNQAAADFGQRFRVFCASMADVFEERDDLEPHRERLFNLIAETKNLDWLILTKRPEFMLDWIGGTSGAGLFQLEPGQALDNVWVGTTAEDQQRWDERLPILLSIPASIRFVSAEPLLGPIDMGSHCPDWLIVGGESGPGARPMDPEWARSLRDQSDSRNAFFFKQWGGVRKNKPGRELDGQTWSQLPR